MKVNSLSILLNILLSFIIIIGVILYLKKDNLNGTKSKEFQKNYTTKSNLILKDLTKNKQSKQMNKELLSDNSKKMINSDTKAIYK